MTGRLETTGLKGHAPDECPTVKRGIVLAPADHDRRQAREDFDGVTFLEGKLFQRVLPWLVPKLNGSSTIRSLQEAPDRPASSDEITRVLEELDSNGFLDWGHAAPASTNVVNHSRPGLPSVVVYGCSVLAAATEKALMHECSVTLRPQLPAAAEEMSPSALAVVIEHDHPLSTLEEYNRNRLQRNSPWMLIGAWTSRFLIGPIIIPGETACYTCVRARLLSHRAQPAAYMEFVKQLAHTHPPHPPGTENPSLVQLAAALAAQQAVAFLANPTSAKAVGHVLVYHPAELRLETERVLKVPWCDACGNSEAGIAAGASP